MNKDSLMARKKNDPIQQQLAQARREQILMAAARVFADKGFQRATIHDVAQAAGIADGTIYIYFKNKTALLLGLLNQVNESERREDDMARMFETNAREFAREYVRQRFAIFTETGLDVIQVVLAETLVNSDLRALYMEQIVEPTFALGEPYIRQVMEQGKMRGMDVPLMMRLIAGMFLGALLLRMMGDPVMEKQWDEVPDALVALMLDGILPKEGNSNESDDTR
jgi:AcrR family transcriptional regulator